MTDNDVAVSYGHDAFDAADLLAMVLDRVMDEWGNQDPDDVQRARDIVRAALVSVIALVGSGQGYILAAKLARIIERDRNIHDVRAALRRGARIPETELLDIYERAAREAEQ